DPMAAHDLSHRGIALDATQQVVFLGGHHGGASSGAGSKFCRALFLRYLRSEEIMPAIFSRVGALASQANANCASAWPVLGAQFAGCCRPLKPTPPSGSWARQQ